MHEATYRLLDHTADMAFRLEAPSWPALLQIGTRAVGEVVLEPREEETLLPRELEVQGADHEDVLVAWLNEAVVLLDEHEWLAREAHVVEATATAARGFLFGRPLGEEPDRVIKAVTYHDLEVRPGSRTEPWRATVVLDL